MRSKTSLNVSSNVKFTLTRLVSPGGGGAFANFALPGGRAFTNPGVIPKLLTRMQFPIRLTTQRILLEKTSTLAHLSRTRKIEEGFKGMFSISCLLFSTAYQVRITW